MPIKFTSVEDIDWSKLWMIVGAVAVFWGSLAALTVMYPAFDNLYKVVNVILSALLAALLFAARANKYVKNDQEPPADGKP